jgi:hypothetical protein
VRGAVVFQVHIAGSSRRAHPHQLKQTVKKIEKALRTDLVAYETAHAGLRFTLHSLQSGDEGIVAPELEHDGNGLAWGKKGHATRYCAVLVRSKQRARPPRQTFHQLKRQSR